MDLRVFILFAVLGSIHSFSFISVLNEEWEAFKLEFGKKYTSQVEESFRRKIYAENKHQIALHNQDHFRGKSSFKVEMNGFGDMLPQEFFKTMNGFLYNKTASLERRRLFGITFVEPDSDVVMPDEVDWRAKGAVTPIKNQGQCGSCWAFSSTGALEGQHFRKTGDLVSLSEQNLMDCSRTSDGNAGCEGGLMDLAFSYVKNNHGIDTEESYPYKGIDEADCLFSKKNIGADDRGFVDVRKDSEEALKKAVATVGPVSIAIDASHESFMSYAEGVYYNKNCDSEQLDHGVLVVGYGTSEENEDFWIVKNSWGEDWGEDGYIRMARNRDNNCGVASSASYPLV